LKSVKSFLRILKLGVLISSFAVIKRSFDDEIAPLASGECALWNSLLLGLGSDGDDA
jgi:hypothetical protein